MGNYCPCGCKHCYSASLRKNHRYISFEEIDFIISEIKRIGVETVNFAGNEPVFTDGPYYRKSKLPYIIQKLKENNIAAGITTTGITYNILYNHFKKTYGLVNDFDISLDSSDKLCQTLSCFYFQILDMEVKNCINVLNKILNKSFKINNYKLNFCNL